ncbi:MAG TPA: amidohydrolase family protein [Terriglobia bacterium]|jgi:enamidase
MDTSTFRRFTLVSLLLIFSPLPLYAVMAFKSGDWTTGFLGLALSAGLCFLYWWPLGIFLAWFKGHTLPRLLFGYLLSLPLYFITLAALYPLFGGAFRPWANGNLLIYLSATPEFYVMVWILFYLSRRLARGVLMASAAVFTAGWAMPLLLMNTGNLVWPKTQDRVAITGARIVDTAAGRIEEGQTIYIKDGRIVEIGPLSQHPDWPQLDAQGQYLLPGLIDVHTHLQSPIELPAGFSPLYFFKSMLRDYAPQREEYLAAGVTSIRDLGGPADFGFALRSRIGEHKILGPRLFFVGRLVTSPHGHPVSTIWNAAEARQGAILARDENTLFEGLNRNLAAGPDAVKFIHGTIGRASEELSADLLAKGVRWSGEHHLISIVHAETEQEFEDAIGAGATGVEHAAYLQEVPAALAALVAQTHPFIDPTFGEYAMDLTMNNLAAADRDRRLECSYKSARALYSAGARMVVGTDAPMVRYGSGLHNEFAHFVRAGFRPEEILAFATVNNAAYLGKAAELGRVAAGYRADLILTKDNPFTKLDTLRHPVWTMLDGQVVSRGGK